MGFLNQRRIYLDAAAASRVRPKVARLFRRALKTYGNPSAPHEEGRTARELLEAARSEIARHVGAKSDAVIFTSGATEANAIAIEGHIRARIAGGTPAERLHVLYLPTQHSSVIGAMRMIEALGVRTEMIPLTDSAIDLTQLRTRIQEDTALISLDVICGETGTRHDTRAVRQLLTEQTSKAILHVDATQAPLVEAMDRTRFGADLISFDAQKIGGIRGIGALIAPRTIPLLPLIGGGGQERELRSGTPSPALASAFAASLAEAAKERHAFSTRAAHLKERLVETLLRDIPRTIQNGGKDAAPHILNISFLGRDTDYLVALLDAAGFAVSTRSSCETDAQGSRVVLAYTNDPKRALSTLRVSLDSEVSQGDIPRFLIALKDAVRFLDSHTP